MRVKLVIIRIRVGSRVSRPIITTTPDRSAEAQTAITLADAKVDLGGQAGQHRVGLRDATGSACGSTDGCTTAAMAPSEQDQAQRTKRRADHRMQRLARGLSRRTA